MSDETKCCQCGLPIYGRSQPGDDAEERIHWPTCLPAVASIEAALAQRDEALEKARLLVVEVSRGDRTTDSWWTRVCNRCDAFQAADRKEGSR